MVKISDCDSLTVQHGGEELCIRFCGIDAPEKDQPLGAESTALRRELVQCSGGQVLIDLVEADCYGRTVAEVWSEKEGLLNGAMVTAGMAFVYDRYVGGCLSKKVF